MQTKLTITLIIKFINFKNNNATTVKGNHNLQKNHRRAWNKINF